jgi:hypothetical protein
MSRVDENFLNRTRWRLPNGRVFQKVDGRFGYAL